MREARRCALILVLLAALAITSRASEGGHGADCEEGGPCAVHRAALAWSSVVDDGEQVEQAEDDHGCNYPTHFPPSAAYQAGLCRRRSGSGEALPTACTKQILNCPRRPLAEGGEQAVCVVVPMTAYTCQVAYWATK